MKKLLGSLVALVLVAALAGSYYVFVIKDPERQIVGKWKNPETNIVFEFNEDGHVTVPIDFFGLGFEADIDGTYVIDKKTDTVAFTFSFGLNLIKYNRTCDFKFEDDKLTLTDQKTEKSMIFTRQENTTEV